MLWAWDLPSSSNSEALKALGLGFEFFLESFFYGMHVLS